MRRVLMMALAAGSVAAATPALATNPPTLHGFCNTNTPCIDNNTNTPTGVNPPQFGFADSGGSASGTLLLAILVPNTITNPSAYSYTITDAPGSTFIPSIASYTASLFSTSAWTSQNQKLDTYLGISASPQNPLGAYLPGPLGTQHYQPSATGYYIYDVMIGTTAHPVTLPGTGDLVNHGDNSALLQLGQGLPQGSYILGFLDQNGNYSATANSGAILETGLPPRRLPEPATWAMMLIGFGGIGVAMRRRRSPAMMQVA